MGSLEDDINSIGINIEAEETVLSILDRTPFSDLGSNRTHYMQWVYIENPDISIRYFFSFDTMGFLQGKFIWKSHSTKEYFIIDRKQAKLMLSTMNFKDPIEVSGKLIGDTYLKSYLVYDTDSGEPFNPENH